MSVQQSDLSDPALVAEVDLARAAAQEEAGDERVGDYVEYQLEDEAAVTHLFEAGKPGYQGWRWAVTITSAGPSSDVTVSEVVLLPGPTALVAPEWIPWQNRVQAGDLGVGDLFPTSPDDPRLVPAYLASDDPAVEEAATEAGLGRVRVMSRPARLDAADRWEESDFGPRSDMARSAPAHCGTCGFYLPLAGSLRAAFGTCGNEISPADGHVVHAEYGCGAHSEAEVEQVSPVLVADLIYDDALLDVEPLEVVEGLPVSAEAPAEPDAAAAEASAGAPGSVAVGASVEAPAEPEAQPADAAVAEQPAADPSAGEPEVVPVESVDVVVEPSSADASEVVEQSVTDASAGEPEAAPVASVTVEPPAAEASVDASETLAEPAAAAAVEASTGAPESMVAGSSVEAPAEPEAQPADSAIAEQSAAFGSSVEAPAEPVVQPVDAAVGEQSAADGSSAESEAQPADAAVTEPSAADASADAPVEPEPRSADAAVAAEPEGSPVEVPAESQPVTAEPSAGEPVAAPTKAEPTDDTGADSPAPPATAPGVLRPDAQLPAEPPVSTPPVPSDAAAPASIEPVVTAETADESTRRE